MKTVLTYPYTFSLDHGPIYGRDYILHMYTDFHYIPESEPAKREANYQKLHGGFKGSEPKFDINKHEREQELKSQKHSWFITFMGEK